MFQVSPAYSHSKTSPPNFKIEIKNTNYIPKESAPAPVAAPPSAAPPKPKTRAPVVVRGYEVAPRFQRLMQRKVEAGVEQRRSETPSTNSQTPRSSVTPPRTPSPAQNPYAFTAASITSANSYRTSPTKENVNFSASRSVPSGGPLVSSSAARENSNGFYNIQPRSPRPLRARLNVAKSSQQLDSASMYFSVPKTNVLKPP